MFFYVYFVLIFRIFYSCFFLCSRKKNVFLCESIENTCRAHGKLRFILSIKWHTFLLCVGMFCFFFVAMPIRHSPIDFYMQSVVRVIFVCGKKTAVYELTIVIGNRIVVWYYFQCYHFVSIKFYLYPFQYFIHKNNMVKEEITKIAFTFRFALTKYGTSIHLK